MTHAPFRTLLRCRPLPAENLGVENDDEGAATWGTARQNIGLELPNVCRRRDELEPARGEPSAIRGRRAVVYEKQTPKPPWTFGEPQLPAAGAAGQTAKWSAVLSAERRQYLLRHALELAFLVVSGDPEQDRRRSGVDVSL